MNIVQTYIIDVLCRYIIVDIRQCMPRRCLIFDKKKKKEEIQSQTTINASNFQSSINYTNFDKDGENVQNSNFQKWFSF